MQHPIRIQRRRTKGWRMPPGTVYVGRGSKWGNPFVCHSDRAPSGRRFLMTPEIAVGAFRRTIEQAGGWYPIPLLWPKGKIPACGPTTVEDVRRELRGKNLACWCSTDEPFCHADILLEIANR
jgi:Domain of unknown function (DUF4326)